MSQAFHRDEIRAAAEQLAPFIVKTPTVPWPRSGALSEIGGFREECDITAKLELLQVAGSFKPRGALTVMLNLSPEARARGVAAASGGNHAIAVAYAAHALGISATVVVPRTANPARLEGCRRFGAQIEVTDSIHTAFERVTAICAAEGRSMVHPFEGPFTALGTATLGLEFWEQAPHCDMFVAAVGGGGLAAGVSRALKLLNPGVTVIGVEPFGADTMWRSFMTGAPSAIDRVDTIADSLGAPRALPYSFELCRQHIDEIVRVTDAELRLGMRAAFTDLKLAVEPAGAAVAAALLGPLRERVRGRKIGIIICGSNIDGGTFTRLLKEDNTAPASG